MQDAAKIYAVIDTNVVVSSMFSLDGKSSPAIVINAILQGVITPLYNDQILAEYVDVLSRPKFPFTRLMVNSVLSTIREYGINTQKADVDKTIFPDPDDIVFYEVKMGADDAFLVTGNIKHFPKDPKVVTPTEMVEILTEKGLI